MASEKAARMQQANTLQEIKESLERIEAALAKLTRPVELKAEVAPPIVAVTEPAKQQGMVTRQNPARK